MHKKGFCVCVCFFNCMEQNASLESSEEISWHLRVPKSVLLYSQELPTSYVLIQVKPFHTYPVPLIFYKPVVTKQTTCCNIGDWTFSTQLLTCSICP